MHGGSNSSSNNSSNSAIAIAFFLVICFMAASVQSFPRLQQQIIRLQQQHQQIRLQQHKRGRRGGRGNDDVIAFAYAPNFITKIITETSGMEPQPGSLLQITSSSPNNKNNNNNTNNEQQQSSSNSISKEEEEEVRRKRSIVTRFPPEPNGYLHIGHAKAVNFNFAVARVFGGNSRCHMRLDDTNPSKEGQEYVESILDDVRWIQKGTTTSPFLLNTKNDNNNDASSSSQQQQYQQQEQDPWYGPVRYTSDYFDTIYQCAISLIQSGDAYVDSLNAEEMREYRGTLTTPGQNSPFRDRSIEENLDMFERMRRGEYEEGAHILRAKINMSHPNLNMRDPALYRIKFDNHQKTGTTWCIYPMYDFSHPISDAIEGITYSLCTLEFEDHRPLYDWIIDKLYLKMSNSDDSDDNDDDDDSDGALFQSRPRQIEFSRLNLKYTVLSKRKLIQLVQQNHVTGWDDPRMPTLCGARRRGIPPNALRKFCERVGISKSDSNIDYNILEDCIRDVMDGTSCRAFAVLDPIKIILTNWPGSGIEYFEVPRHPKNDEMGTRTIPFGKELYIERSDFFDIDGPEGQKSSPSPGKPPKGFKRLLLGENGKVRLKYAYVICCNQVKRRHPITNEPIELECTYYPETRSGITPKGMKKVSGIIQWVEVSTGIHKCSVNQYDRLFHTEDPGSSSGENDNDFIKDLNPNSLKILKNVVVIEPSVALDALAKMAEIRVFEEEEEEKKNMKNAAAENGNGRVKPYHSELSYQFERNGYFALDTTSSLDHLVFNRVVTLRDTWDVKKNKSDGGEKQRQRGTGRRDNNNKSEEKRKGGGGDSGGGIVEDARRVALRAATILEAKPHPEAESLIVCKVDCGDKSTKEEEEEQQQNTVEPRVVVAGLAGKIPLEELVGRKVVCVTNLKPAKMRGIESTAMLLAASSSSSSSLDNEADENENETVELLDVPESVPNGELLQFEGKEVSQPDAMLKSKGALKAWDRVKVALKTNENGEVIYEHENQIHRIMTSAGCVKTASLKNADIQ